MTDQFSQLSRILILAAKCLPVLFVVGCAPTPSSLKDAYADYFMIGGAMNSDQILGIDAKGQELVVQQFNTVTAENEMKWEIIEPMPGQFDFRSSDALVSFSEAHDIFVVGHTLLWHSQTPNWVFEDERGQPATRELLLKRLKNHIDMVVGRYKGRVKGWDVVNEAFEDDGSLRQTKWLEIIGPDYIEQAFRFAHAADPDAALYYNEYSVFKPAKRAAIVALVESLKSKGVRIDGVGIQGHYGFDYPDLAELEASIIALKEAGVQVMFTELDISVIPFPDEDKMGADISLNFELQEAFNPFAKGLPPEVDQELADNYVRLFEVLLRHHDAISRVTFWGVEDGASWRNNWPMAGRTDYPLVFGRDYQPKKAFHALMDLVD